jgi:hypothetical protein
MHFKLLRSETGSEIYSPCSSFNALRSGNSKVGGFYQFKCPASVISEKGITLSFVFFHKYYPVELANMESQPA